MIDHLDNLIRHLLIAEVDELTDEAQVRFQPPDDDWRTYVSNLTINANPVNALNIYLFDLREHKKLRSNERIREVENGVITEHPAPRRMDCHYLITAWSPATVTASVEPSLDEHALIYKVASVLTNSEPLVARRVYDPFPLPNTFPEVIADADLPTTLLPAEGFPKYGEFWGTMGASHRWRPAVYYIVTLPLVLRKEVSGPMVTTRIAEYRFSERAEIAEVMIEIGGVVLAPAQQITVAQANVNLAGGGGATATLNNASVFRVGDTVTVTNTNRATITQIQGNDVRLNPPLTGLAAGNVLRIANLVPTQSRIRLNDISKLQVGGLIVIAGENANNAGTPISERAVVISLEGDGFAGLADDAARNCPPRTNTYRLDMPPATIAPTINPLVSGAWVRLEDQATGAFINTTSTDQNGRFRFGGLSEGNYVLRVRAQGFAERVRNIQVPSPTGEYDVRLV